MCKSEKIKILHKSLYVFSIVAFVVSAGCKLYFANKITVENIELTETYDKKALLEKEVYKLGFVDSELSCLSEIEEKARNLGFIDMEGTLTSLDPSASTQVASLNR